jgi:hypothetical protein
VKDKSFNQPQQPTQPDSGQEEWITWKRIRELYPQVRYYQLRYWRESKQVRYKNLSKTRILYIESDIHAQVEYSVRPKKRNRLQYVKKKLANIDVGLFVAIVAVGLAFAYYKPWSKDKTYYAWEIYYPLVLILFFVVVYFIGKGIMYLYRRFIRKGKE